MKNAKLVSIIIPCLNEEGNIPKLINEIDKIIKKQPYNFEVILINDGSKDDTWGEIEKAAKKYSYVRGIDQMGHFGQSQAYQTGFDNANGEYILILSADLEIPTENILKVIRLLNDGFDFVNTNRNKRWNGVRKSQSGFANWLLNKISGNQTNDRGSGLKGFTRPLVKELQLYGDMHRFLPDYLSIYKPKTIEFDVEFQNRKYGSSAYKGTFRSLQVFLDILTLTFLIKFAYKPFFLMPGRLFGFSGFIISSIGFVISCWMIFERIFFNVGLTNRPIFILSVMMVLIGLMLLLFGLFGELMMRVYFEASGKKRYMSRRVI